MNTTDAPARLPDPREHPTLNLWPATGRLLGLSRQSTYDAATRGDIPTIRIGRRILVPTAALARLLCIDYTAEPGGVSTRTVAAPYGERLGRRGMTPAAARSRPLRGGEPHDAA